MNVVQVRYYTDPACPWSWALEPALRKLIWEFAEGLHFRYVVCGMLREGADPLRQARQTLEAAGRASMPVDARLWLEGAPTSSYPACIAVKAAAEQADPGPYLRRLREGLMCRRRKLDTAESLIEEARALGGRDVERFRIALASHATLEAFGADLELAEAVAPEHQGPGTGRVRLPSLEFLTADGETARGVYGFSDYATLRDAALAVGAATVKLQRAAADRGCPAPLRDDGDGRSRLGVRAARPPSPGRAVATGARVAGQARAGRKRPAMDAGLTAA